MKKFTLLLIITLMSIAIPLGMADYYQGHRTRFFDDVDIIWNTYYYPYYHPHRCGSSYNSRCYQKIAQPPRAKYSYKVQKPRPFVAHIVSDKTVTSSSHSRWGDVRNIEVGEKVKFYPDFTGVNRSGVTWKWHYDSRGLECSEASSGTLDCTVVSLNPSDVWAEFFVPAKPHAYWGKT